jgi:hypothetical protein
MNSTPSDPSTSDAPPVRAARAGIGKLLLQVGGFCLCMGLLWWCVHTAMQPENEEKLRKLLEADKLEVATLLLLQATTVFLNGSTFWMVLRPVHKLKFLDMQAVNATASFMSYAPGKVSLLYRLLVHTRRDGLSLLTIGAWMGAFAVILFSGLIPLVAIAAWRKHLDATFIGACIVSVVVAFFAITGTARLLGGDAGLSRIRAACDRLPIRLPARVVASGPFIKLHAAFDMLASRPVVGVGLLVRFIDLFAQAARFMLAGHILGTPVQMDTAVMAACTYYMIGLTSPSGSLGAREGATTGLASLLAVPGMEGGQFAPIALTVSVTEFIVFLSSGLAGVLWIRPWKLLAKSDPSRR